MAVDTLPCHPHVFDCLCMQAAAQALAAFIEHMPSEQAALPAMLRQGAEFGVESAALIIALANTGLRITDGDWASLLTSCPPPEVQAYQHHCYPRPGFTGVLFKLPVMACCLQTPVEQC